MKNLLLLLFILLPFSLLGQSGTKDGSFDVGNMDRLQITIDAGMTIKITGSDTDKITYTYEFDGNNQAYNHRFKNFDPKFSNYGGTGAFNIEFPAHKERNVNYRIKKNILTLEVPKEIELSLNTRYSKIEITSIARTTDINNRSGSVKLRDVGQSATVSNDYGDVDAESINGDLTITSRSSNIDVKNITGKCNVSSNYSKVNMTKVTGKVTIENKSGTINAYDLDSDFNSSGDYSDYELTDIRGFIHVMSKNGKIDIDKAENVLIDGDYTDVTASNISGDEVVLSSKSAKIDLKNVLGKVSINGSYLEVDLDNISQEVSILNKSGKIEGTNIQGSVIIQGDYNEIDLNKFSGAQLTIESRSGKVDVDALKKLDFVSISARYTDVKLNLGTPFEGQVNLEVTYGKLKYPFKLYDSYIEDKGNTKNIQGWVGTKSGKMMIQSRNGDVTIEQ